MFVPTPDMMTGAIDIGAGLLGLRAAGSKRTLGKWFGYRDKAERTAGDNLTVVMGILAGMKEITIAVPVLAKAAGLAAFLDGGMTIATVAVLYFGGKALLIHRGVRR